MWKSGNRTDHGVLESTSIDHASHVVPYEALQIQYSAVDPCSKQHLPAQIHAFFRWTGRRSPPRRRRHSRRCFGYVRADVAAPSSSRHAIVSSLLYGGCPAHCRANVNPPGEIHSSPGSSQRRPLPELKRRGAPSWVPPLPRSDGLPLDSCVVVPPYVLIVGIAPDLHSVSVRCLQEVPVPSVRAGSDPRMLCPGAASPPGALRAVHGVRNRDVPTGFRRSSTTT